MFTLSPEQQRAVGMVCTWYKVAKRKQVFSVAGYAGVGKSTIVRYAIEALGLNEMNVRYLTFTGKASLVLTRKGNSAQTIHSFCYEPKIVHYNSGGIPKTKIVGFDLRREIDPDIKLLVLDEASMISTNLLRDICSFNTKILALGDPAQLPPVKGAGNTLFSKPDVFLERIHRQAEGSPIIWVSMLAREGRTIPYGTHGGVVRVVPRRKVDVHMILNADQTITCKHENRIAYNEMVREYLGFDEPLPVVGEKLICLKNNWKILSSRSLTPLINGLTGRVRSPIAAVRRGSREFDLDFEIEGSPEDYYPDLASNLDFFDPKVSEPDTDGKMAHFDRGYAITCHRSQGSEWPIVLYVHDAFGGAKEQRQLLYTGVSRASNELTIAL